MASLVLSAQYASFVSSYIALYTIKQMLRKLLLPNHNRLSYVLHPVYAGPMPAAPPSEIVPGQPSAIPGGMVLGKPTATHYGTVQGQPAFIGSPYMQPASTAPPVPEHKDKPSSPSSEQQEDAPPSYDVATGGER